MYNFTRFFSAIVGLGCFALCVELPAAFLIAPTSWEALPLFVIAFCGFVLSWANATPRSSHEAEEELRAANSLMRGVCVGVTIAYLVPDRLIFAFVPLFIGIASDLAARYRK